MEIGADCEQTGRKSWTRGCSLPVSLSEVSKFQPVSTEFDRKLILLSQADATIATYTRPEPNQEEQESFDMPECSNCYCPASLLSMEKSVVTAKELLP